METRPHAPQCPAGDAGDVSLLARVTSDLAGGDDPAQVLQRFLAPVVEVCGAEAGVMRVLAADGRELELVAAQGLPPDVLLLERSVGTDCGVCGVVAGSLDVAWSDGRRPCGARRHPWFEDGGRRVLAVPLAHRARLLGLCSIFIPAGREVPAPVVALLKTLGEVIGLALHGARLEREVLRATLVAERQWMAAEVHDSVAQTIAYAKMRLPLLEAAVQARDGATAQRHIGELRQALGQAHTGLRGLIGQWREPDDADDLRGVLVRCRAALQEQAAVDLQVRDDAPDLRLSAPQEHHVQRIVQEAVANIARHAGARHAWLTIERHDGTLEIRVDDDGCGLPEAAPGDGVAHFGLEIMRQRAALLGGTLEVERRGDGGTRVRLAIPVTAEAA